MYRKNKPQGLLFGAVALAIMVGAFLSTPLAANEPLDDNPDGLYIDRGPGGLPDRDPGSGGQDDGDQGDSTDPDWFGYTSWNRYTTWGNGRVDLAPAPIAFGPVNAPFVFVANWLLRQVSSQYLRIW